MADKKQSTVFGLLNNLASMINCTFRGQNTDVQSALNELSDSEWIEIDLKDNLHSGITFLYSSGYAKAYVNNNFAIVSIYIIKPYATYGDNIVIDNLNTALNLSGLKVVPTVSVGSFDTLASTVLNVNEDGSLSFYNSTASFVDGTIIIPLVKTA